MLNFSSCSSEKAAIYGQRVYMEWITKKSGAKEEVFFSGKKMHCLCPERSNQILSNIPYKGSLMRERIICKIWQTTR
jgi:hypothetical protein